MIRGLENLGNTCYMNSILQLLFQCPLFVEFILRSNYRSESIRSFQTFLRKYKESSTSCIVPVDIKQMLHRQNMFNTHHQYDAHEFMMVFLDLLDKEIKTENPSYRLCETFFHFKYQTIIKNLSQPEVKTIRFEELFLMLPYSESLDTSLRIFESPEIMDQWESELFHNKVRAEKSIQILELPPYFFIMLNRFDQYGRKIDKPMTIPFHFQQHYQLTGAVIHHGVQQYGHYISVIRIQSRFFICDDDKIREINQEQFIQSASIAYLLLFTIPTT